ncbi:MAG: cbb3-type cytochrome c oxidase subunit I, partial [Xanthobacteraceae bacterium]
LSFLVWLHHFFTMGASADVNGFFGVMTMIIAVPTGVKVFNWLFTMFRGRIVFRTPMLFAVGFIVTFVIGGLTGVLLAVPPVDFVLHNSAFLVAHFHNVIIGGVVFGALAGINYWFPKAFGFKLDERLGHASFWCWLVGFYLAFIPLYWLGLMGMTRRLEHIPDPAWRPLLLVAEGGAIVIFCGILCQIAQLYVSIRARKQHLDSTGDPWNGRTLEWSTPSPPPHYNFAVLPRVEAIDAFWQMKRAGRTADQRAYESIEMPRNSPAGFITAFFAVVMGFSLIWHIWWLALLGFLAAATMVLIAGWSTEREHEISAAEVAQMERGHLEQRV